MDDTLKQRLVGAAVLVGLAVIFVPMLIDERVADQPRLEETNIPPPPAPEAGEFTSRVVPLEPVQPVTPPPAAETPVTEPEAAATAGAAPPAPEPAATAAVPQVPSAPGESADADGTSSSTPKPVAAGVQAWVVQLGSFASEQNARDLESRLQKEGYAAFVEKLDAADGTKFRVRVGPELDRAKAEATLQKLDKEQSIKGIVVRYP